MNFLTDSGNGMLYLLGNGPSVLASNHLQEQNYKSINVPEVLQSSPEGIPPALVGDEVVFSPRAEAAGVGEGVVDPPQPRGQEISQQNIYGVVTAAYQQEDRAAHGNQERGPVEELESPWGICRFYSDQLYNECKIDTYTA